jgi:plasmid stabilization system protein ParE
MANLRICSAAATEFSEALAWYMARDPQVAANFDAAVDEAFSTIATAPDRYPHCDSRHRYFLLSRFPYQIVYRPSADEIVIIAVAHTHRQSEYWKGR